jgi:large subunit ribosomal protein L19
MDIGSVVETKVNEDIPEFRPGDTLKVKLKIIEGERERSQTFESAQVALEPASPSGRYSKG